MWYGTKSYTILKVPMILQNGTTISWKRNVFQIWQMFLVKLHKVSSGYVSYNLCLQYNHINMIDKSKEYQSNNTYYFHWQRSTSNKGFQKMLNEINDDKDGRQNMFEFN